MNSRSSVVGVDIGGTKMLMIAKTGDQWTRCVLPTGADLRWEEIEHRLRAFVLDLNTPVASVGIAIPGLLDNGGEVISCDVLPQICGWNVTRACGADVRTHALNDAEAALVEEASSLAPSATAAVIGVGTGIGAALLLQGIMCRGWRGWAGELGSIPIYSSGGIKTLDQLASGAALLASVDADSKTLNAMVKAGVHEAVVAIRESGRFLGLGISIVINLFNPQLVSLYGGVFQFPGYLDSALESAASCTQSNLWRSTTVRLAPNPDELVARGALRWANSGMRS